MARRPRITQKEVAAKANVSQTLVSLVLSGADFEVAESTRKQILDAAKELGYQVKARPKAASRQRLIAYIRPVVVRGHHPEAWIYDTYDAYYDRMQNLLLEEAYRQNYSLIVRPYQKSSELMQWLSEWELDGVIWHGEEELAEWVVARHPTVQLFRGFVVSADAVLPNQEETVTIPMDYLRSLGHERIAFLFNESRKPLTKVRFRTYRDYLMGAGMPQPEESLPEALKAVLQDEEGYFFEDCSKVLIDLIKSDAKDRPTAIITSDHYALYCMRRLQEAGIRLPEEMSFVGIDNTSAAAMSYPALTSIDNRLEEIAKEAMAMLIARIKGTATSYRKISITPALMKRESAMKYTSKQAAASPD